MAPSISDLLDAHLLALALHDVLHVLLSVGVGGEGGAVVEGAVAEEAVEAAADPVLVLLAEVVRDAVGVFLEEEEV